MNATREKCTAARGRYAIEAEAQHARKKKNATRLSTTGAVADAKAAGGGRPGRTSPAAAQEVTQARGVAARIARIERPMTGLMDRERKMDGVRAS